jgi:hypothetical protein
VPVDIVEEVVERAVPKAAPLPRPEDVPEQPEVELHIPQSDLEELVSLAQMAVNRRMGIRTDATTVLHGLELQDALDKKPKLPAVPR